MIFDILLVTPRRKISHSNFSIVITYLSSNPFSWFPASILSLNLLVLPFLLVHALFFSFNSCPKKYIYIFRIVNQPTLFSGIFIFLQFLKQLEQGRSVLYIKTSKYKEKLWQILCFLLGFRYNGQWILQAPIRPWFYCQGFLLFISHDLYIWVLNMLLKLLCKILFWLYYVVIKFDSFNYIEIMTNFVSFI